MVQVPNSPPWEKVRGNNPLEKGVTPPSPSEAADRPPPPPPPPPKKPG